MAKGKEHKKYEFGTKASLAMTKTHGVIVAAVAHEKNLYDGHTLPEVLDQAEAITDTRAARAIVIAATAAANLLMALRSWCQEELPADNPEQRARRCESAFAAERLLNPCLVILSMTFGSCAASSKASKAINSI